ncbi:MAG: hypothetical protein JNM98_21770 [Rhodocyclaceae bacterium]|nr:hypothetical protein [Rhodocyclaceae bacterium]
MKKQTVFIVMAQTDYESSVPVRAFLDEAEAEAFAAKCNAHRRKAPQAPETIEDTPENGAERVKAFWVKHQRWAKRHPAGEGSATCDSFQVIGIPLVTPNV